LLQRLHQLFDLLVGLFQLGLGGLELLGRFFMESRLVSESGMIQLQLGELVLQLAETMVGLGASVLLTQGPGRQHRTEEHTSHHHRPEYAKQGTQG
jgi:hypothetical protein